MLIFFVFCKSSLGQIHPSEGSRLHYRLIGFTFPKIPGCDKYTVEIAKGNIPDSKEFNVRKLLSVNGENNKIIAEVPVFGAEYTWRVICHREGQENIGDLHHFSTGMIPEVDTSLNNIVILNKATSFGDAYFTVESNKAIYDMNGSPVWYLPMEGTPEDMKVSSKGTITFMMASRPYEIDYEGNILWTISDSINGRPTVYTGHHEFFRTQKGTYMMLEKEKVIWNIPGKKKVFNVQLTDIPAEAKESGVIREYDERGKEIWSWHSIDHLENTDLYAKLKTDGKYDLDIHENGVFFDEKNNYIYVSCKHVSRIIKIKYPSGHIVNNYGSTYGSGSDIENDMMANSFFKGQHSCRISSKGELYLYNNNAEVSLPKIIVLKEPGIASNQLEKIWEYECVVEDPALCEVSKAKRGFQRGGNIEELPGNMFFVSMSAPYPKLFIVNAEKKEIWGALVCKHDAEGHPVPTTLYRASFIKNRGLLESMALGGKNK